MSDKGELKAVKAEYFPVEDHGRLRQLCKAITLALYGEDYISPALGANITVNG